MEQPSPGRYWRRSHWRNGFFVHGHWVRKSGRQSKGFPPSRPLSHLPPPRSLSPHSPPPASRRRSKRRRLAIGVTATIVVGAGAATISVANSGNSTGASNSIRVQANINLSQAIAELSKLGFAGSDSVRQTDTKCAQNASGDVRKFLTLHPCKEYAIASIKMHKQDVSTAAAVSWVVMPSIALANRYKAIVDRRHSGNPPGESAAFNGLCYASGQSVETVWVDQVRPTGHPAVDRQILQAVAPVRLPASYLKMHCIS